MLKSIRSTDKITAELIEQQVEYCGDGDIPQ